MFIYLFGRDFFYLKFRDMQFKYQKTYIKMIKMICQVKIQKFKKYFKSVTKILFVNY